MTFELLIDSIDRISDVSTDSLVKMDIVNEQKDSLNFQLINPSFTPAINQEVEFSIDGTKEFGGVIINIEKSIVSGQTTVYKISCVDYTQYLNRKLVTERYDNSTVIQIIEDVITDYASDFTTTNVDCDNEIKTVVFNRATIPECLTKLAKLTGYYWYVDYDKDIHFFSKTLNVAPFDITDTNGKYNENTLIIKNDLSQLRNVVVIRGSEERGVERTEEYIADGEQVNFPLANKFAEIPTVNIESTAMVVGVDYLTEEDDADCFWSFGEKYIRFKDDTKPLVDEIFSVTGIPLFPILVKVPDNTSIETYGYYEFFKEDKSIKSREEALRYAEAELDAYANGIDEGSFTTSYSGLRSGQKIKITSDKLDVDEDFIIQSVQFNILAKEMGNWSIKLATAKTLGIIELLQELIRFREVREYDPDTLLSLLQADDLIKLTDSSIVPLATTSPPYQWVDDIGDQDNPGQWNSATWWA